MSLTPEPKEKSNAINACAPKKLTAQHATGGTIDGNNNVDSVRISQPKLKIRPALPATDKMRCIDKNSKWHVNLGIVGTVISRMGEPVSILRCFYSFSHSGMGTARHHNPSSHPPRKRQKGIPLCSISFKAHLASWLVQSQR